MKCLVLAGGFDQIALIQELKKRNITVVLVDYFENPPAKKFADKHYIASTLDIDKVLEIAEQENVDIVTTACTDQALLTVAKVSEVLNLPFYISYQKALEVTNKAYMKEKMQKNGIPTAKYVIFEKFNMDIMKSLKFPLVVKPVDCNSSKGVKKIFLANELEKTVTEAIELSRTNTALVEEFKDGIEISADVYVENGQAKVLLLTESTKMKNNNNRFTILQSIYPVNITQEASTAIDRIAQRISEVFGIDNSPMLIQLITDGTEVNVVEFSARMGGGTKYKLIEVLTGVNIMGAYVDRILGKMPKINCSYNIRYAQLNYCYCYHGVINRLENFTELKENGIIHDFFQYKEKGMEIIKAETSGDRAAGYLLTAETITELQEKANIANQELKVISQEGNDILVRHIL